jgi:hypothetical protein
LSDEDIVVNACGFTTIRLPCQESLEVLAKTVRNLHRAGPAAFPLTNEDGRFPVAGFDVPATGIGGFGYPKT